METVLGSEEPTANGKSNNAKMGDISAVLDAVLGSKEPNSNGKSNDAKADDISAALDAVWTRARIRAFAHHFAAERLRLCAHKELRKEAIWIAIGSSLLLIGLFLPLTHVKWAEVTSNILFLSSALVAVISTFLMTTSERRELAKLHGCHRVLARLYMNLSQKTRRVQADVYSEKYYLFLVSFLNDALEALVTAGENPEHPDYELAEARFEDLKNHQDKEIKDSFLPGINMMY